MQNFVNGLVFGGQVQFDPSNMSAFGVLEVANPTPVFQTDFVYGLNTQIWQSAVVSGSGATVDTDSSRLRIQSGTNSAGYAYILPRRSIRYRAGQGTTAIFTPIFDTGIANNTQLIGIGSISSNVPYDGYFFGFNGVDFGIVHYVRGTPTWTAQTAWNGDKLLSGDGTFTYDPTKGSPVMIKYPYLGFGDIEFFIQNPDTGRWLLVHIIKYANTVATTQLSNPSMYFLGFVLNSGNTTNKTMYCGSIGIFISGMQRFVTNPKWGESSYKASITTETVLLSIKNCSSYNGFANRGLIRFKDIGLSSSAANGIAIFRMYIGTTIGGSPSYAAIKGTTVDSGVTITSGNSIASFDVAGTTVSGGNKIWNSIVDNPNSKSDDLEMHDIILAPGEILTITGFSSISSTMGCSLNWTEDI